MPWRLSKIAVVAAIALWLGLVAFGNITDYGSNWPFVQHVLAMDTVFPDARIRWRAISAPWLQHAAYLAIILAESLAAILCGIGAVRMWRARRASAAAFHHAKAPAVLGLTLGVLLWLGAFMAIGGEWFGMWMSADWNATASAFRFVVVLMLALLYLGQREEAPDDD
ncbi:MAG: DUF2165 domain-containing protein [Xanthomonadales bacterium]|nr:DUF2165 domain-containing protein [Xanthomonadales bacterium]